MILLNFWYYNDQTLFDLSWFVLDSYCYYVFNILMHLGCNSANQINDIT